MFTAQWNAADLADASLQRVVPGNTPADIPGGAALEERFALAYETALDLYQERCEAAASRGWLEPAIEDEDALESAGFSDPLSGSGVPRALNAASGGYRERSSIATVEETWQDRRLGYGLMPPASAASALHGNSCDRESIVVGYGAREDGSAMGRCMSREETTQAELKSEARPPADHSLSAIDAETNLPVASNPPSLKSRLARWMDDHALIRSSHHCAMYCRKGMEAAGLTTGDRPQSGDAGDYGPFLVRHGAQAVPLEAYTPQVGDTAVFDKTEQHPNGHIEIYDGQHWVSDFMQRSFSPYRDAGSTPPFTIYRLS